MDKINDVSACMEVRPVALLTFMNASYKSAHQEHKSALGLTLEVLTVI